MGWPDFNHTTVTDREGMWAMVKCLQCWPVVRQKQAAGRRAAAGGGFALTLQRLRHLYSTQTTADVYKGKKVGAQRCKLQQEAQGFGKGAAGFHAPGSAMIAFPV